jgi:GNAT superfamily N-acetyltransferase
LINSGKQSFGLGKTKLLVINSVKMSRSNLQPGLAIRSAQSSDGWKIYQLISGKFLAIGLIFCPIAVLLVGIGLALQRHDERLIRLLLFSMFGCGITSGLTWLYLGFTQARRWIKCWLISDGQRIVALAEVDRKDGYSVLDLLYVVPDYRRRGIGSHFMEHLARQVLLPLYVTPTRGKINFYSRLGFVRVSSEERRYGTFVLRQFQNS